MHVGKGREEKDKRKRREKEGEAQPSTHLASGAAPIIIYVLYSHVLCTLLKSVISVK